MNRKEFFQKLGLSTGAIMAVYCMGGVTGCSSSDDSVTPDTGDVDFTLDLSTSANESLNQVGGFVVTNQVVVARVTDSTFAAVTQVCSHQGQRQVTYDASNEEFHCTAHGARYDTQGDGLNANGSRGLTTYQTTLDGNMLRVFS